MQQVRDTLDRMFEKGNAMTNEKHEVTNTRFADNAKSTWELVWENLQLLCLGLTIAGQIFIGGSYVIGQGIWLVCLPFHP